ncbi:MAG: imidazole glycerol phosphate synthase subunit HisH [Candidatus Tectomicrobia bacterium]|nr:imidazole glycerol phosphate synthase subunit HisH [Candidatus Tectomicrobia bacterium]
MIAILDYKAGNLASVKRALDYLGYTAEITDDPSLIMRAEKVIFPGVGAAGATMENLKKLGLVEVLREEVYEAGKPLLGICIGIQVIFQRSEEDQAECLGLLEGVVKRFPYKDGLKVPQIGWNRVWQGKSHPIFHGVPNGAHFYFVNSYYPAPSDPGIIIGTSEYGVKFPSVIAKDNLVATQFHLEKSGEWGLRMLDNFCRSKGEMGC